MPSKTLDSGHTFTEPGKVNILPCIIHSFEFILLQARLEQCHRSTTCRKTGLFQVVSCLARYKNSTSRVSNPDKWKGTFAFTDTAVNQIELCVTGFLKVLSSNKKVITHLQ